MPCPRPFRCCRRPQCRRCPGCPEPWLGWRPHDEERQLQVKLYASSPEEAHLLSLLTLGRSLADANTCADLLWQAEQRALPRLKCGLLADSYRTIDEFVEAAQKVFADCQAQKTVQAGKSENRDAVLEEFRKNPNIRVVVSCTRVVGVEYFSLPMNDPQLSAVFNRLDELGEGMYSLGIEACCYKDHWPDTFGEVLREEGLFALNALAAALLRLLTPDRSLADANLCAGILQEADTIGWSYLEHGLQADSFRDLDDYMTIARRMLNPYVSGIPLREDDFGVLHPLRNDSGNLCYFCDCFHSLPPKK